MLKYYFAISLLIISQATCLSQIDNNGNLITYFSDPPSFNNGSVNQFAIWVYSNITYPETALQDEISGRVIARIFIDSNGKVDSVKIIQGVRYDIDQEAKRVIESSPTWTPAKASDLPIGVFFSLPIDFTLDDQQFKKKIEKFSRIEKRNRKKHYR
jgi:TonB family protein